MGNSASVTSCDGVPRTCRICLSSSHDEEPEASGDTFSLPASEVQNFANYVGGDDQRSPRLQFLMENEVISPCDCSGTQQHVHLHCLLRWVALQPSRATHCEICNGRYRGRAADALQNPAVHSFFRIHRTLFGSCTTNNRYDRSHGAALSSHMKDNLIGCMHAGGIILQTTARAAANVELNILSSEGSSASLLVLLLASRRTHWNSSAFLIVFSRPHVASDSSMALIAVNITQQLELHECPAALEFQRIYGLRCTLYRGGPCKSNRPIAILSVETAEDSQTLFQKADAVYHPNLVHMWQCAQPPCSFYRLACRALFLTYSRRSPHT
jgi:hypothetical protein